MSPCWPYPRWIAHRGAGKLAPENTLAAFRLGARLGYRMSECDVKLSADGVPFLLHDSTLERTTNGVGNAGNLTWRELALLDAGAWHSAAFAGEPLVRLDTVARYCIGNQLMLNIEIKPTPGLEALTGTTVADAAASLWAGVDIPPLLTSFKRASLEAARIAQPQLPRALLIDEWEPDWLDAALSLQCAAVVCNQHLWDADTVSRARHAGLRLLSYTVNDERSVQRLLGLNTDGIITDMVHVFDPER
jgi:glycerophosphoryl diester phosphodiesterase